VSPYIHLNSDPYFSSEDTCYAPNKPRKKPLCKPFVSVFHEEESAKIAKHFLKKDDESPLVGGLQGQIIVFLHDLGPASLNFLESNACKLDKNNINLDATPLDLNAQEEASFLTTQEPAEDIMTSLLGKNSHSVCEEQDIETLLKAAFDLSSPEWARPSFSMLIANERFVQHVLHTLPQPNHFHQTHLANTLHRSLYPLAPQDPVDFFISHPAQLPQTLQLHIQEKNLGRLSVLLAQNAGYSITFQLASQDQLSQGELEDLYREILQSGVTLERKNFLVTWDDQNKKGKFSKKDEDDEEHIPAWRRSLINVKI
jgi:hypothetical protein